MNTKTESLKRITAVFLTIIFLMSALSPLASITGREGSGSYPAPAEGDWRITQETHVSNETIYMNGNIFVQNGGSLYLENVTIIFNSTKNGEFRLDVQNGGELYAYNSTFDRGTDFTYGFRLLDGGKLRMENSTIRHCGYNAWNYYGLVIYGNDVVVRNNLFTEGYMGVYSYVATRPIYEDNEFINNTHVGLYLHTVTGAEVRDNIFIHNNYGIYFYSCTGGIIEGNQVMNNTVGNARHGIELVHTKDAALRNNYVNNTNYGLFLYKCHNLTVHDNLVTNNAIGLAVQYSDNVTAYNDRYFYNHYGAYITYDNTNITLRDSNASFNRDYNIYVYRTKNSLFMDNEVHNSTKYHGLVLRECTNDTVKGNRISNIKSIALWLWSSNNITLKNNKITNSATAYYIYFSEDNRFYGGDLENNKYGIFVRNSTRNWIFNTTSLQSINDDVYLRNASTDLFLLNTQFSTKYFLDDASNFTVFNYLNVEVQGRTGPVPGVEVEVMETLTGKVIYSTPYFGGTDPKTDDAGMVKGIIALYSKNNMSGTEFSRVRIVINDHGVFEKERYADMDTSHTEVFTKNALTVDQNGNGDYLTIQQAVDAASDGDAILVAPGTYRENVVIDKGLRIYGKGNVILDGMNGTGFDVQSKSTLANITITNSSLDVYVENNTFAYNMTISSVNYTNNHFLAVGYYLNVRTVDDNGEPIPDANLTIENRLFPRRSYHSDPNGWINSIALVDYVNTSSSHYALNPYYLNASKEFRFANQTINITSNMDIDLPLTRHGMFGASVLSMDINRDGYTDYIVGAPYDDEGGRDAGAVFIFYGPGRGKDTLLPIDADHKILGEREYSHFGCALAKGDVNGDGVEDLIVGADGFNSSEIHGILGKYYDSEDFTGYRYSRVDQNINFPWDNGGPPQVGDKFAVKWDGYLYIKKEDSYMFYFEHDDGVRLYIDDKLVVDAWTYTGHEDGTAEPIALTQGFHAIHIDFFDSGGNQKLILKWSTPTLEKEIIPAENFYLSEKISPGNGTVYIFPGQAFDGSEFDASAGSRIDGDFPNYGHHLFTGRLNDDNRTDILVGYEGGTRVIYGGPMISKMTFHSGLLLSDEWDPIIKGKGGDMYLTGNGELAIDGSAGGDAYAYSTSKHILDSGIDISITLEPGEGAMFFAGIDYKVPAEDVSNLSKQESHTLFALYNNGQVKYWPTFGGSVKTKDNNVNNKYTFRVKVTENYDHLYIYLNGEKKIDEALTGWHPVYLKLGDSYNFGSQVTKIVEIAPTLLHTDVSGLEKAVILNNNETLIAATIGADSYLLNGNLSGLFMTSYSTADDFQGKRNFTTFEHGLTLSPFYYATIVSNGNFDNGWENWSQVQNTQGDKDSGTRWAIVNQTNGDWWVHNGSTAGFGSDVDELPDSNSYRDCRGMLKSEVFTIPDDVNRFHFWFHFHAKSFEAAGGWQGNVPDSVNYSLFNANNDRKVKTLYKWAPSSGSGDNEASGEINADVSDLHGMNLYFGMEIITNHGQRDKAIAQVDDIFGAKENQELKGDFISNLLNLSHSFSAFIPVWHGNAHGGNITLYYRTNESDPWTEMKKGLHTLTEPASSIQYRIVMEGVHGNPYPVLNDLQFTFFDSTPERVQRGWPADAGQIFEDHTLGVVNGSRLTLYDGKTPFVNITLDSEIDALSQAGDVDANGENDLFVSGGGRVYLFLANGKTQLNASDANYTFAGEKGFGLSLYHSVVGSPLERAMDGSVYLIPVLKKNLAILDANLENHSLIYPNTNRTLKIKVKNTGLDRMEGASLTLKITAPGYSHEESLNISLDAGEAKDAVFVWHVPEAEGLDYTVSFSLSSDMQGLDNFMSIQVKSRYHRLELSTSKDYDALAQNRTAHYRIVLTNTGTLGADDVQFNATLPSGWEWHLERGGTNFTHVVVETKVSFDLYVKTNSTLGTYPISIRAISENGTADFTLPLYTYIVDRDIVPVEVMFLREDGKVGTPITGENTTVILRVLNNGTQNASAFSADMFIDGKWEGTANVTGALANTTVEFIYHTVFTEGDHTLLFRVDPEDAVKEYNEQNNEITQAVTVKPEISTTPYLFVVHVTDLNGKNLSDVRVRVSSGSNVIENITNRDGISHLTLESYPEGDIYLVEAISGELYTAKSVAVYSEDAGAHIELVVGRYSMDLLCGEKEKNILPNGNQSFEIRLTNTGDFNDTYTLSLSSLPDGWGAEIKGAGVVNGSLFIGSGETEVLEVNISSALYAPAHERYDIRFGAASQFSPYSQEEITLRVSVLSVDKIIITTDSTEETGSPGDPISHRITITNKGNAERDITIAVSGDTEYIDITRTEFHLAPGEDSQFWFTINVPNLRAGTVLHQDLYGIVAGVGPTDTLSFNTTIRVKHSFSVDVQGQTLYVTNNGNVLETLQLKGTIQYGNITPVPDSVVLDIGEKAEIPLSVEMTDMSIPADSGISIFVTLFNGENYYNSSHTLAVPKVYNLSLAPVKAVMKAFPGERAKFEVNVLNTGNIREDIFFSGTAETGYLIVPSPVTLQPSQEKSVKVYLQTPGDASGIIHAVFTGRAGDRTVSTSLTINLSVNEEIILTEISVSEITEGVRYTLNLYNSGEVDETVELSTDCGELDTLTAMVPADSTIQLHLTVRDNEVCGTEIHVNARAGNAHSSLTLTPPPRAEINVLSTPPFTVRSPVMFEGTGNYQMYTWKMDDGRMLQGKRIYYNFTTAGNHTIQFTVTDSRSLSCTTSTAIDISNLPPEIQIRPLLTGKVGKEIEFDARDSTDPDGEIVDYIWEMDNETYHGPHIYHAFSQAGTHEIKLTIVDNLGAKNTTVSRVTIQGNEGTTTTTEEKKEINTALFALSTLLLLLIAGGIVFLYFHLNHQEGAVLKELAALERMRLTPQKKSVKAKKIPERPVKAPSANDMEEINICPNCGAEVPVQFNFCNKCGAPISKAADAVAQKKALPTKPEPEYRVCPSCGAHVPPHFHYCNRCGAAMDGAGKGVKE